MAVEACDKQKEMDYLDDDDAPMFFKRNSSSSKQNQSNPETKNSLPQKLDQKLGRPALNAHPQNGQNNFVQKTKMGPSSRTPPDRSPLMSPKLSNSPTRGLTVKSVMADSIPSTSMTGELNSVKRQITVENALYKSTSGPNEDSEDSEDDKPLTAMFPKVNSGNGCKGADALKLWSKFKDPQIRRFGLQSTIVF